jgi:hypothetical protein
MVAAVTVYRRRCASGVLIYRAADGGRIPGFRCRRVGVQVRLDIRGRRRRRGDTGLAEWRRPDEHRAAQRNHSHAYAASDPQRRRLRHVIQVTTLLRILTQFDAHRFIAVCHTFGIYLTLRR